MPAIVSRDVVLKSRPVGEPTPANFEIKEVEAPEPGAGEVQVQNLWMSVDPYMRGRMMDRESYVPPFQIGETLTGGSIGKVIASNHPGFAAGDIVNSMFGWREAYTAKPEVAMMQKVETGGLPEQAFLGIAGMPGLTAYAGLTQIGQPKEGETVFVSGAAGAVGSTVCQIAKIKGCKVIGSAGGKEKVDYVKSLGVDEVIDYKAVDGYEGLLAALKNAAPKGIDIYFDNVGGDHLEAAIEMARPLARMPLCGMIAQYNATEPVPGPRNMIQLVGKQIKMQGFIVSTYANLQPDFVRDMSEWIGSGKIKYTETVKEGIEAAPSAFIGLFSGENKGKMLVKLS